MSLRSIDEQGTCFVGAIYRGLVRVDGQHIQEKQQCGGPSAPEMAVADAHFEKIYQRGIR
jgi:hypothetical protein